jgi:hypothetical protein
MDKKVVNTHRRQRTPSTTKLAVDHDRSTRGCPEYDFDQLLQVSVIRGFLCRDRDTAVLQRDAVGEVARLHNVFEDHNIARLDFLPDRNDGSV